MRFTIGYLVAGVLLAAIGASAAQASSSAGYVSYVYAMPSGQILFNVAADRARPACAVISNRWAFDGSTPAGQAKLATLLTAYALHKSMTVIGTGVCNVWGDTETADWFRTDDP